MDSSLLKGGKHAQTTEKPLIDTSVITNLEQGATSVEPSATNLAERSRIQITNQQ